MANQYTSRSLQGAVTQLQIDVEKIKLVQKIEAAIATATFATLLTLVTKIYFGV